MIAKKLDWPRPVGLVDTLPEDYTPKFSAGLLILQPVSVV